jgi:DNA-directed RNA polymerase specialized sigma24 family protein
MSDPLERARLCIEDMEGHRQAIARLAEMRAEAIREALAEGMSRSEVARALGVSQAAITKLLART